MICFKCQRERLPACIEQVLRLENVRCHYALMNQQKKEKEDRRSEPLREQKEVDRKRGETRGEGEDGSRAGTAANEEESFGNGLRQVCGEPVARQ